LKVRFYPDLSGENTGATSVFRTIEKLKRKHQELYSLVREVLLDVEKNCDDLSMYQKRAQVSRLRNSSEPIWEFRIPKTRRGGVVRIYFCYHTGLSGDPMIVLLSMELKKTARADRQVVAEAERNYRELMRK
jgi:phage-related protein